MDLTSQSVDAQDQRVRILLTLSNLQLIRSDVVPQLITQFETNFSVKLTDETKTIRDVLGQIDARLFHSYTAPIIDELTAIVRTGVLDPQWAPTKSRPSEVRPYVYQALLCLVMVHAQTSTTAPVLTPQILSYLMEQTSKAMLQAFRQRSKFSLAALMQATLDVEFVAQTLSQYTTDKASELQSQIYLEIDQGTDNEARRMLQNELPQMRNILKVLRENSKAEL
jgi:exocyst complex component 2